LLCLTRLRRYVAAVTGGMGGIGQGIVIALTQRDFDVVVCDQTSCVTERSILRSPNVSQPMRPLVRTSPSSEMISPIPVIFPASSMQYSLPSGTWSVWSIMLAYLQSHEATCSTSPPRADLRREYARCVLPTQAVCTQAVCKKMLAAEADFPESARSVVFISSSNAVIAAPDRGGVCDVQSDGRQTAKLFAIRLAPNGIAVYEVPARSESHADDRCGSIAF
jgi:3-oxoacyl-[acyl-carrier protein] reductase